MAAAQRAAATDGPGPDPGPDPAATCATARWPRPVYFIYTIRKSEENREITKTKTSKESHIFGRLWG